MDVRRGATPRDEATQRARCRKTDGLFLRAKGAPSVRRLSRDDDLVRPPLALVQTVQRPTGVGLEIVLRDEKIWPEIIDRVRACLRVRLERLGYQNIESGTLRTGVVLDEQTEQSVLDLFA